MAVKKILPIISYDDLLKLSIEQLQEMLVEYRDAAIIQRNIEQAIKILINSLYGYLGSVFSRFYERYMAEGITLTGQLVVRTSERAVNNYLNELTKVEKDRCLYVDTDSVAPSTLLIINKKKISIEEYYDTCDGKLINDGKETKYIIGNDLTPSYDGNGVVENRITYAMRHKVTKNHYKITVGDKSVIVTEDHSVMVFDENDNLIRIKPKDMNQKIHRVIKITSQSKYKVEITNNFSVECLGEFDEYVYDIEVENTHNFFGNNILVHNSNYFDMTDVVNLPKLKWKDLPDQKIVDNLDKFVTLKIDDILEKAFDKLAIEMNSYKQTISMKRESIGKGVFVAPKNYTLLVYDNEGQRYLEPKLKITGLEAVRSDTPKILREKLKEMYKMMYYDTNSGVQLFIKDFHDLYMNTPLFDIGEPTGVSIVEYTNSNQLGVFDKGTPYHVKAAFTYNTVIKNMNLMEDNQLIREGDKIKLFRLKKENPYKNSRIAIVDKIPPELELEKYVDREEMFEKFFIKACNRVLTVKGWSAHKKIDLSSVFDW